jgi:hypothetical protein
MLVMMRGFASLIESEPSSQKKWELYSLGLLPAIDCSLLGRRRCSAVVTGVMERLLS